MGAMGDARLYETLAGWLLNLAGVRPLLAVPEGIEVTERWHGNRRLLFVLNHTDQEQEVALDGRYTDLLDASAALEGRVTIAPLDVLILLD